MTQNNQYDFPNAASHRHEDGFQMVLGHVFQGSRLRVLT